jgi:hypothetical protein
MRYNSTDLHFPLWRFAFLDSALSTGHSSCVHYSKADSLMDDEIMQHLVVPEVSDDTIALAAKHGNCFIETHL